MNDLRDLDLENRLRKTYRAVAEHTRTDVQLPEPHTPRLLVADDLAPRRRRRPSAGRLAVAAAALVVVGAVAMVAVALNGGEQNGDVGSGGELILPDAPIKARHGHSAVWTGTEMIVFGGYNDDDGDDNTNETGPPARPGDAAAYDPATRSWRRIADLPEGVRGGSLAVWTGTEVVAIYISGGDEIPVPAGTPFGAVYNPATDQWRLIEPPGFGVLDYLPGEGRVTWTGDRVLVAGLMETFGDGHSPDQVGAATYDPATGAWERLPDGPVPFDDVGTAVWTGTELVYVGPGPGGLAAVALDPVAKSWRALPPSPLERRANPLVAWSGSEVIVAGGMWQTGPESFSMFADAAALDPATGQWSRLPDAPADTFAGDTIGAAGGNGVAGQVVTWASWSPAYRMLLFDAADRTWTWGPGMIRGSESVVSTGTEVIVWGGLDQDGRSAVDTGYVMSLPQ